MECLEVMLPEFARHGDGGEQRDAHVGGDALLDGFDAGEFSDVAGADVLHGEDAIEFGAISASMLGEEQGLSGEVGGLDGAQRCQGVTSVGQKEDALGAQRHGIEGGIDDGIAHVNDHVDFA